MEPKIHILYIGRNEAIRELVVKLINKNEAWSGFGAATKEEVITCLQQLKPALVLMGNGIDADEEVELCELMAKVQPGIKIIQHYGGGSGLLHGEIMEALSRNS